MVVPNQQPRNVMTFLKVCCDRLLLTHSANFIKLTFVVVRHKIFSMRLFYVRDNCLFLPPPHLTPLQRVTGGSSSLYILNFQRVILKSEKYTERE